MAEKLFFARFRSFRAKTCLNESNFINIEDEETKLLERDSTIIETFAYTFFKIMHK